MQVQRICEGKNLQRLAGPTVAMEAVADMLFARQQANVDAVASEIQKT